MLAALAFLYLVRGVLLPFILAIILAIVLDPLVRRLRMRGWSRRSAALTVCGAFFLVCICAGILIVPTISRQLGNFRDKVDEVLAQFTTDNSQDNYFVRWNPRVQARSPSATSEIDRFFDQYKDLLVRFDLPTSRRAAISQYVEPHRKEIAKAATSFFSGLLGFISGFGTEALLLLFTPIFLLSILLDLERLKRRTVSWIPPAIRGETVELVRDVLEVFSHYLRGVATVLFWYVIVAGVLLSLLGAPYSILLAILFAILYLIPYLGPVLNVGLLVLITGLSGYDHNLLFGMPSSWTFGAVIAIVFYVVMMLFDQLVYTRTVGKSVGLNFVVSFFVVFSGAALFGPIGMVLAFPVAGSVKVILDRLLRFTTKDPDAISLPSIPLRHRAAV